MIGGFVALAGLILYQSNATRAEIREIRAEVTDLGESVTRIEMRLDSFETRFEFAPSRQPELLPEPSPGD